MSTNPIRKPVYPRPGEVYTYAQIMGLTLRDSPHLGFLYQDKTGVIQDSHVTEKEFASVPGILETQWRYIRETSEWIPLFEYAGPTALLVVILDMEPVVDATFPENSGKSWWATPKGFPRKQYET